EGGDRDGPARSRLQSHARHEYHWGKASPRGNPRMRAALLRQNLDSPDHRQRSGGVLSSVRVIGFLAYPPPNRFRTAWVKTRSERANVFRFCRQADLRLTCSERRAALGSAARQSRARANTQRNGTIPKLRYVQNIRQEPEYKEG